ncbi:MAG: TatD family hydrolase [Verrucomicrobia bacterium]|nr:TatD family hydrolase [Verrucomicrobiota bacterium]
MTASVEGSDPIVALYDAHNHLQDDRFAGQQEQIVREAIGVWVRRMVVNGACEEDWPLVLDLARRFPCVAPSFGYHPWHLSARTPDWERRLSDFLELSGGGMGEIGLDRWKEGLDWTEQELVFVAQWRMAVERGLPISVHCLKAWGALEQILRRESPAPRGFLLHSYGGSIEMIPSLVRLGAYFSFPGYFLNARKSRQAETFRQVPRDRLLVETDAPDQMPPESAIRFPFPGSIPGSSLNHPGNLRAIYEGFARVLGRSLLDLAEQTERNFHALFGGLGSQ